MGRADTNSTQSTNIGQRNTGPIFDDLSLSPAFGRARPGQPNGWYLHLFHGEADTCSHARLVSTHILLVLLFRLFLKDGYHIASKDPPNETAFSEPARSERPLETYPQRKFQVAVFMCREQRIVGISLPCRFRLSVRNEPFSEAHRAPRPFPAVVVFQSKTI